MGDLVDAFWRREFVAGLVFGTGALILAVASGLLLDVATIILCR